MGIASLPLAFFFSAGIYATVHSDAQEIMQNDPGYAYGGITFYFLFLMLPGVYMIVKALRHKEQPKLTP